MAGDLLDVISKLDHRDVQIVQVAGGLAEQAVRLVGAERAALGVVRNPVQGVHRLVVVVAPAAHLALEPGYGSPVDDDRGTEVARDIIVGQLDEDSHELRDAHAVAFGERGDPVLLIGGYTHVDVLAVFAQLCSFASWQADVEDACLFRGAGHPPQSRINGKGFAAYLVEHPANPATALSSCCGMWKVAGLDPSSMLALVRTA